MENATSYPTRLLRKPAVLDRIGLGNSALYSLIAKGEFPAPVRLSQRSVAWREDDVERWINERPRACGKGA